MRWYDRVVMYVMLLGIAAIVWKVLDMDNNVQSHFEAIERGMIALLLGSSS